MWLTDICVTNSPHRATPRVKNKGAIPSFYHTIIFSLLFLHNTRKGTAPPRCVVDVFPKSRDVELPIKRMRHANRIPRPQLPKDVSFV